MSATYKTFLFVLFLWSPSCLKAQQVRQITMEEAIQLALKNSFDIYENQYNFEINKLNWLDQKNATKPTLQFSSTLSNYTRSIQEQWSSEQQQYLPFEVQRLVNSGNLRLSQPISFTGGSLSVTSSLRRNQTFSEDRNILNYISTPVSVSYNHDFSTPNKYRWGMRIGKLRFEEAKLQHIERQEEVASKAVTEFYKLLIAQNQLSIAELEVLNADSLLWMAQEKRNIFAISKSDYLQLELQLSNANIRLEKAQNDLTNKLFSFNIFLGLPVETPLKCLFAPVNKAIAIEKEVALSKVFENNSDQLSIKIKLIETEKFLLEAKRQPYSLSLNANLGLNQNKNKISEVYSDLLNQQGVGLTMSIPIYTGGSNSRRIQRARLALEYQQKTDEQSKIRLTQEIIQRVNDYRITSSQLKAYAKSDTLGRYAYQAVKERFILGKANIIDVIDAEERRQSARLNYLKQLQSYWTQYYAIRRLCLYDFKREEDLLRINVDNK